MKRKVFLGFNKTYPIFSKYILLFELWPLKKRIYCPKLNSRAPLNTVSYLSLVYKKYLLV